MITPTHLTEKRSKLARLGHPLRGEVGDRRRARVPNDIEELCQAKHTANVTAGQRVSLTIHKIKTRLTTRNQASAPGFLLFA